MGEPRVAIIGSGFGGLAAAIRLQAAGARTVLYEAHDRPGGRAGVYEEGGHTFDLGPTVITAPHCLEELFSLAGERLADRVQLLPVTPFCRLCWADGTSFDYGGTSEDVRAQVAALAPEDLDGFERFMALQPSRLRGRVRRAGRRGLSALCRHGPGRPAARALAGRSIGLRCREPLREGRTPAPGALVPRAAHRRKPVRDQRDLHADPVPRAQVGRLLSAGRNRRARAGAALYRRLGGHLRLGTPVDRVKVESAGRPRHVVVTGEGGRESFDAVVSNADLHHTYARLYAGVPAADAMRARLERMAWSMSLVVVYFGTRRKYPGRAHHTVLFGPRYREMLREIFHGPSLPPDFSLYLHQPTVTYPRLAPPGGETFYALAPVPHLGAADVDWATAAEPYVDRILASLEVLLPDLRREITVKRIATPFDFRDRLNAFQGSAFSLAPRLTQSAYFRPHNRDSRIPGLYLAGAGTHPGVGVPGVINAGKATARLVAADLGLGAAALAS